MIKGVNRQVVDIPQPESAYFERAIFFVKPECSDMDENSLRKKADSLISSVTNVPKSTKTGKKDRFPKFIFCLMGAVAGAVITAVIEAVIH